MLNGHHQWLHKRNRREECLHWLVQVLQRLCKLEVDHHLVVKLGCKFQFEIEGKEKVVWLVQVNFKV